MLDDTPNHLGRRREGRSTDDFGFKLEENAVEVHDLHAMVLHLMGFEHEKFTYRYAGRDFRLTVVHSHAVKDMIT